MSLKRLANVGGKDDPKGALQDLRAGGVARQRKYMKKVRAGVSDPSPPISQPKKADFTVADDPPAAIQDFRAAKAAMEKTARARRKGPRGPSPDPLPSISQPKKADFTIADEAASALGDKGRLALVERHAHRLGIADRVRCPTSSHRSAHVARHRPARHGLARAEHVGQAAGAAGRHACRSVPASPAG